MIKTICCAYVGICLVFAVANVTAKINLATLEKSKLCHQKVVTKEIGGGSSSIFTF